MFTHQRRGITMAACSEKAIERNDRDVLLDRHEEQFKGIASNLAEMLNAMLRDGQPWRAPQPA